MVHDVVILGSGPAGLTAALYAARARLDTFVVAGLQAGGQLMLTTEVENYPGFPKGVMGPELMRLMREQAGRFGVQYIDEDVVEVGFKQRPFTLKLDSGREIQARTVIIATGASAKWIGAPGEEKLRGHGVSSCATCDGAFFKSVPVVVVGGGDSAMEEALFLTRFASHVTVVHRRDEFRASKIMQERLLQNPKIKVEWNAEVLEILGEKKVEGVRILTHPQGNPRDRVKDLKRAKEFGGEIRDVPAAACFVAIGHEPNTAFLRGHVEVDAKGYLAVRDGTRTSVEGVFAAGDVRDARYRQAVTAAGMGCMAAMDAEKWLEAQHR